MILFFLSLKLFLTKTFWSKIFWTWNFSLTQILFTLNFHQWFLTSFLLSMNNIKNNSPITVPILTKLFVPNFWGALNSFCSNFFLAKFFDQHFVWSNIFLSWFFWTLIFWIKFSLIQIFLVPTKNYDQIISTYILNCG